MAKKGSGSAAIFDDMEFIDPYSSVFAITRTTLEYAHNFYLVMIFAQSCRDLVYSSLVASRVYSKRYI